MAKIDGRTLNHKALEHMRILAVKRVVEDSEAPSDVMKSLGLCRTSIYRWLRKYEDQGMDALVETIAQGPVPKLSEKQWALYESEWVRLTPWTRLFGQARRVRYALRPAETRAEARKPSPPLARLPE